MTVYFQPFGAHEDHGPLLGSTWTWRLLGYDAASNLRWPNAEGRFTLWHDGAALLDAVEMEPLNCPPDGWLKYKGAASVLSRPGRHWWRAVITSDEDPDIPGSGGTRTYTGEFVL